MLIKAKLPKYGVRFYKTAEEALMDPIRHPMELPVEKKLGMINEISMEDEIRVKDSGEEIAPISEAY